VKALWLMLLLGWAAHAVEIFEEREVWGRYFDGRMARSGVISVTPSDTAARALLPRLSEPRWVAPSDSLPPGLPVMASNNNVAIQLHDGRLFLAWRTAPIHFAAPETQMHVVSSGDGGRSWRKEHTLAFGHDLREPLFVSMNGRLHLYFLKAGKKALGWNPQGFWRVDRRADGSWTKPVEAGEKGELAWDIKVRDGKAWMTSYKGNHYGASSSAIELLFKTSDDGVHWRPVAGDGVVRRGGDSEASFEFDGAGDLWAVTRNEDGDESGFGSHLAFASRSSLGDWEFPARSDPHRYDSPKLFRHGSDVYMIARRDPEGPFDQGLDFLPEAAKKAKYLSDYGLRPKRTTLYRIDRKARRVVPLMDLPGCGDTAFPSVQQTGPHTFLIANYTSSLSDPGRSWIDGQTAPDGSGIYLIDLSFEEGR
jgi:hypothetical protein